MKRIPPNPEYAIPQTVLDLATKFEFPDVDPLFPAAIPGGKGGSPTVVVAASDATDLSKSKADFVCTGADDQVTIQEASDLLTVGGRLLLTEGVFSIAPDSLTLGADIHLQGLGAFDATVLMVSDDGTILNVSTDCIISDIVFDGQMAGTVTGVSASLSASNVELRSVRFNDMAVAVAPAGDDWRLLSCAAAAFNIPTWVASTAGHSMFRMSGCLTGGRINLNGTDQVEIVGNIIASTVLLGTTVQDVTITGNTFWSPAGPDTAIINGTGVTGLVVSGNSVFESFGYEAVLLSSSSEVVISGNVWAGVTAGVGLSSCSDVVVVGNHLGGDGYLGEYGVSLSSCDDCVVSGNLILEPGQDTDDSFDGVIASGNRNLISGNKVVPSAQAAATRYGINLVSGNDNAVFANYLGDISAYGTADFNDGGTATQTAPGANGQFGF